MRGLKEFLGRNAVVARKAHEGRAIDAPVVLLHAHGLLGRQPELAADVLLHALMDCREHPGRGVEDRIVHVKQNKAHVREPRAHLPVVSRLRAVHSLFNRH